MFKSGDVFRWSYKDEDKYLAQHRGSGTAYWCMDCQCFSLEKNGKLVLIDTYWNGFDARFLGDSTHYVDPERVDLEFICNLNDIEFIKEYEQYDYDKVYNLSHQKWCYKLFAIDKGAEVSKTALLKKYQEQLRKANEDLRSAQYSIERIEKDIEELYND